MDETTGQVYRFSPRTGFVDQGYHVEYGSQAFSGNANQVWIMQNPLKGLVLVENGSQMYVKINQARQDTLDREGRLWQRWCLSLQSNIRPYSPLATTPRTKRRLFLSIPLYNS